LQLPWVQGLPAELQGLTTFGQSILNSIWTGLFRGIPSGDVPFQEIINGLQNISPLNVQGLQGGTIADTFQGTVDTLWGGFAKLFGQQGKSIFDVASLTSDTVTTADTGLQVSEWNNAILGFRGGESLFTGIDPTEVSNFDLDRLFNNAADPVTLNASAGFTPMAFYRAKQSDKRGYFHWFGKGFANVTSLFLDFYKFNYTTNQYEVFHTSPNQIGAVTAVWASLKYNMAVLNRFQLNQGETIGVGWRVVGTGTHSIAGLTSGTWLPNDNTTPAKQGAIRTDSAATTVSFATLSGWYSGNVPWMGLGIATGDVVPDYHAPRTTQITTVGPYVYDVPDWADVIDEIKVGAAGGGHGGDNIANRTGEGGWAGLWDSRTLTRGVDFPDTTGVQLTGTIGTGGAAGGVNASGGAGTATTRAAIAGGDVARSAAGGVGGTHYDTDGFGDKFGDSPGNHDHNGVTYPGGGIATGGSSNNGAAGQPPGGGGGGGGGGTWGIAWVGGPGARGGAWYVARQL
jgi:hypothetical protein